VKAAIQAGRPKTKPLTEELERLLEQEAPNGKGQTWAAVILQALLTKARKGDVRAFAELANRVEGRSPQAVDFKVDNYSNLAEEIEKARKRVTEWRDNQRKRFSSQPPPQRE